MTVTNSRRNKISGRPFYNDTNPTFSNHLKTFAVKFKSASNHAAPCSFETIDNVIYFFVIHVINFPRIKSVHHSLPVVQTKNNFPW